MGVLLNKVYKIRNKQTGLYFKRGRWFFPVNDEGNEIKFDWKHWAKNGKIYYRLQDVKLAMKEIKKYYPKDRMEIVEFELVEMKG